jgi:hypothetical protein
MSMLRGNSPSYDSQSEMKMRSERCKPDYETMIANARKQHASCQTLLDAITDFTDGNVTEGKLAELAGEVYLIQSVLTKRIESMIKEQEESNGS